MITRITVGGLPGSGTSTLCRALAEAIDIPYVYAGSLFREQAKARGLTLAEFGALCEKDDSVDRDLDASQARMLLDCDDGLLLEGRLSGWLAFRYKVPALKVWVICPTDERIRRITERDGGVNQRELTLEREKSEHGRYRNMYNIDLQDFTPYDVVLDSSRMTTLQMVEKLVAIWDLSCEDRLIT
jgi:cytidylate kinase